LSSSQAASGLVESSLELEGNTDEIVKLLSEKRSIDLVKLNVNEIAKDIDVSESQINDFYENNQQSYQAPEQVSVEYLASR